MANSSRLFRIPAILAAVLMTAIPGRAHAQPIPGDAVRALAPTGKLRVGVLMVWYFALEDKASGQQGPLRMFRRVSSSLREPRLERMAVPLQS